MPELPDVTVYVEALESRLPGGVLRAIRLASPFVLRSVEPPITELVGREVAGVRRMAKRIVIELAEERFIVIHLMVAGHFKWDEAKASNAPKPPARHPSQRRPSRAHAHIRAEHAQIHADTLKYTPSTLKYTPSTLKYTRTRLNTRRARSNTRRARCSGR